MEKNLVRQTYTNPALEAFISATFGVVQEKAKVSGESLALKNLPPQNGDHMDFFEEYHEQHQSLIHSVNTELSFETTRYNAVSGKENAEKEIHALHVKKSKATDKLIECENRVKNMHPSPRTKKTFLMWLWIAVGVLCLAEGIFTVPILQIFGLNFLEALIFGIIFGSVLSIYAHSIPWLVSLGKTVWQRWAIIAGLFILTFAFFFFLGSMRANYLMDSMKTEGATVNFSAWPFALASILLLLTAMTLPILYYPSDEEKRVRVQYEEAIKEKELWDKEIAKIEGEITEQGAKKDTLLISSAAIIEYGQSLEHRIISHARLCFSLFKKHNLMHRTDGIKPDSFREYPFAFATFFNLQLQRV